MHGWRNEEEEAGRAPFVRRNLLLLHFVLYCEKIELSLQERPPRPLTPSLALALTQSTWLWSG